MRKYRSTSYGIFVKKLSEKVGRLFLREDIEKYWLQSGGPKSRFSYGLGKAKNQEIIESIGGGIFMIAPHPNPLLKEREPKIIDDEYWQIVSLLIREHAPSGAIIAHEKSMELYLRDYSAPERLVLYTRDTAKRIQIGEYEFHFRTLKSGEKSGGKNMYRILENMSREVEFEGISFSVLTLESSLLDVASLRTHESGVAEDLLIKFLKKYEKELSREKLGLLVSFRYIRGINRLRALSKTHGFTRLYEMSLDIIKREGGGCYLSL